jgi:hypothetical protein
MSDSHTRVGDLRPGDIAAWAAATVGSGLMGSTAGLPGAAVGAVAGWALYGILHPTRSAPTTDVDPERVKLACNACASDVRLRVGADSRDPIVACDCTTAGRLAADMTMDELPDNWWAWDDAGCDPWLSESRERHNAGGRD